MEDCVPCILRHIFPMGFPLVMHIRLFCRHNSPYKHAYIKKYSTFTIFVIFITCLTFQFLAVYLSVRKIMRSTSMEEMYYDAAATGMGLIMISETLYFMIYYKFHFEYLNITIQLVENRKYYSIDSLLSEKYVRNTLRYSKLIVGYGFLHFTAFGVYRIYGNFTISNCITQIGRYMSDMMVHFIFVYGGALTLAYQEMFRVVFNNMETMTVSLLKKSGEEKKMKFEELENLIVFYLFLKRNYQNHVIGIGCLIVYITGYSYSILSPATFCILLYNTLDENTDLVFLFDFTYRYHIFYKFSDYFYFVTAQRISLLSEDLISILYKYPLSKLTAAEACKVEMLVTTLVIEKPELRASNIFTVGTNLLSSISGNFVTYVLVALQFNAAFSK